MENKKPIIGVIPLWDDEKESIWMLPGYMDGISKAGGLPVILPMTSENADLNQIINMCDGFLFTGGHDVSTWIYNEEPVKECGAFCKSRDDMETKLLKLAMEKDKPLLGICRGIQFINASLGGDLYQDLPTQRPTSTEHHMTPPYDKEIHKVDIIEGSPLYSLLGKTQIGVNSYHHQAIKNLSPKLKEMAKSEDGLIEAVYMPDKKFLWAVQWHPEFSFSTDDNSMKILSIFVKKSKI